MDQCEYRDAPKMRAGLIHLFEGLHIAHCGKEVECMATAVGWPLFWVIQLPLSTFYPCGCASFLLFSEDKFPLHLLSEWWQTWLPTAPKFTGDSSGVG